MGLIDDLLKQQAERIASCERRLEALEAERRSDLRTAPASRDLKREVLRYVERHWASKDEPVQQRFVSQTFSRAASREGGLRVILDALEHEGKLKILRTASGANLLFPSEAFATLSPDAIEALTFAGLTDAQRSRLKARQNAVQDAAADAPDDDAVSAANAEAVEAFKRSQQQ